MVKYLSSLISRLRSLNLNSPDTSVRACVLVPILFGMYSLWLGADANWDLYNYHLYNPYAWLNDRLAIDIAPAGMQTYFNPVLDVPFYWMNTHLPSRLAGFLMGALHGLSFILILGIAKRSMPSLPEEDRYRIPLLIAVAGCLTANYLSGLGNSMGDVSTSLFSLAALLVLLSNWERLHLWRRRALFVLLAAGILIGLGAGLKLTNATYALAMCLALLSYPAPAGARFRLALLFGIGALLGFAITGGYWLFKMWTSFGNPLYPQFSALFPNPLTVPQNFADTRWLPRNWIESAFWPFITSIDSRRVGEAVIHQIIWPILYLLFWAWVVAQALPKRLRHAREPLEPPARFILIYVALSYIIWMKMFSIYRYIVPVEVLTPLLVFFLLHRLLPRQPARRAAAAVIGIATLVVVAGGAPTWGHNGWSDPLYHAQTPEIQVPGKTTVVMASRNFAWAWLATLFPPDVAFAQIEGFFPASARYSESVRERIRSRGGPAFAIIDGTSDDRGDKIAAENQFLEKLGVTRSGPGCSALHWITDRFRKNVEVLPGTNAGTNCQLGLKANMRRDVEAENHALATDVSSIFGRNGLALEIQSCRPYYAGIGRGVSVYQWCRIHLDGK